jgi:hypothetical protein
VGDVITSLLFLGFHSKDFPHTPHLIISARALQICEVQFRWLSDERHLTWKTQYLLGCKQASIGWTLFKLHTWPSPRMCYEYFKSGFHRSVIKGNLLGENISSWYIRTNLLGGSWKSELEKSVGRLVKPGEAAAMLGCGLRMLVIGKACRLPLSSIGWCLRGGGGVRA